MTEFLDVFPWYDSQGGGITSLPNRWLIRLGQEKGLNHHGYRSFSTDVRAADIVQKLNWDPRSTYYQAEDYASFLVELRSAIAVVWQFQRQVNITVSADSPNVVMAVITSFEEFCEPIKLDKPGVVPIKFWTLGPQGPDAVLRDIDITPWVNIQDNYAVDARDGMDRLLAERPPFQNGNLLLLHGPPGVGKTHAIRALAATWLPFCDFHYVLDPEEFFGRPFYMSSVLLDERSSYNFPPELAPDGFALSGTERWKLLIVEDADELLAHDARRKSGQSLSRLLNLADGIVGQGLKTLTLITTNEPLESIHPAIERRGRCMAKIHFDALDHQQARRWLAAHGIEKKVLNESMTLADLYEEKRAHQQIDVPKPGYEPKGLYV